MKSPIQPLPTVAATTFGDHKLGGYDADAAHHSSMAPHAVHSAVDSSNT